MDEDRHLRSSQRHSTSTMSAMDIPDGNKVEHCQQLISLCRRVQHALPPSSQQDMKPLTVFHGICVQLPSPEQSLSRLDDISLQAPAHQLSHIRSRYWAACQQGQQNAKLQYLAFCDTAKSIQHQGGITDYELQKKVAEGFERWYDEFELKLASVVLARFRKRAHLEERHEVVAHEETVRLLLVFPQIREPNFHLTSQPNVKHILRRAFAANPSPTDAERDYLARQTGMTYRQVTVWVSTSSPIMFTANLFISHRV